MGGAVRGCLVRSALVESRRRGETLTEDDRRTPAVGPVEVLGADRAMRDADGGQFAERAGNRPDDPLDHLGRGHPLRFRSQAVALGRFARSEEHTSELQSLMRISYAVFCLKKKKT